MIANDVQSVLLGAFDASGKTFGDVIDLEWIREHAGLPKMDPFTTPFEIYRQNELKLTSIVKTFKTVLLRHRKRCLWSLYGEKAYRILTPQEQLEKEQHYRNLADEDLKKGILVIDNCEAANGEIKKKTDSILHLKNLRNLVRESQSKHPF